MRKKPSHRYGSGKWLLASKVKDPSDPEMKMGNPNSPLEHSVEYIAGQLGITHQAVSSTLRRVNSVLHGALAKLEESGDFDHQDPAEAETFFLALRAAFAERKQPKRAHRLCEVVKPLPFARR